jgi:tetratricopeptide (TPR) repeat protein
MKLKNFLATVALLSTLCSACARSKPCITGTLAEIAITYAVAGQNEQALQVAQKINRSTPKADALSQIAVQLAQAGQSTRATDVFTQALQFAHKIDSPPDKVMALAEIAARYGKVGQKDKAAEVLAQAVHDTKAIWGASSVKDTVLEKIAVNYAQLGDYERGIQVANKILGDITKGRALAQIAVQYVVTKDYNHARQLANTIEAKASQARAFLEIAAKTGDYQPALSAAQQIDQDESAPLKSLVLCKIASSYSKTGQKKQASQVLAQALNATKSIEEPTRQVEQLTQVALLYAELGEKAQVAEVFSQALQQVSQLKESDTKAERLARLAVKYGQAGEKELATSVFNQALSIAQSLPNKDKKTRVLASMAIASAQINPYNQVLEFTHTITDANTQASVLIHMAKDYTQAGDNEEARQALNQALAIVQAAKNTPDKAQKLAEIALQLVKIAQYDQALTIAQTLDMTEKDSPKAAVLARIAKAYAKVGQKEKAIALLSHALQAAKVIRCSY